MPAFLQNFFLSKRPAACAAPPIHPRHKWTRPFGGNQVKKKMKGIGLNGEQHGDWSFWYPSGDLKATGRIDKGVPACSWKECELGGKCVVIEKEVLPDHGCQLTSEQIKTSEQASKYKWWNFFQINELALLQASGGKSYNVELGWNPRYLMKGSFSLLETLSFALIKNTLTLFPSCGYLVGPSFVPLLLQSISR